MLTVADVNSEVAVMLPGLANPLRGTVLEVFGNGQCLVEVRRHVRVRRNGELQREEQKATIDVSEDWVRPWVL